MLYCFLIVMDILTDRNKETDMELPKDPMMLYSVINLKLRDYYPTLDALCEDMEADRQEIIEKLQAIGLSYDEKSNRFC